MTRVPLAGVCHETNTFSRVLMDTRAFHDKLWARGHELAATYAGTRTVMGGFLGGARERRLDTLPPHGAYATPPVSVTRSAYEDVVAAVVGALERAGPFDGLLLELHGAMVVEDQPDPETQLLTAIRDAAGDRPIVAVNRTAREHDRRAPGARRRPHRLLHEPPHVDTYKRGVAAAGLLEALLRDAWCRRSHTVAPSCTEQSPGGRGTGNPCVRGSRVPGTPP